MSLYAYSVVDSSVQVRPIAGLCGAAVRNLPYRDIGVVVSELPPTRDMGFGIRDSARPPIPDPRSPTSALPGAEPALIHAAVNDRLMADYTVLPVRFGTVLADDAAVREMAAQHYAGFRANLTRLAGAVEFGLRVLWPGGAIRTRISAEHHSEFRDEGVSGSEVRIRNSELETRDFPADRSSRSSLRAPDWMRRKLVEYRSDRSFEECADREIAAIDGALARLAAEKRCERLRTENLLFNAYYLVPRSNVSDFRLAFGVLKLARPDLKYLLSGPWPPYNFVVMPSAGPDAAAPEVLNPQPVPQSQSADSRKTPPPGN